MRSFRAHRTLRRLYNVHMQLVELWGKYICSKPSLLCKCSSQLSPINQNIVYEVFFFFFFCSDPLEISTDVHMWRCGGSSGNSLKLSTAVEANLSNFKREFLKCRHYNSSIRTSMAITNKMKNSDATASASLNNYWSRIIASGDPSQTYSLIQGEALHLRGKHLKWACMLSTQWIWAKRCQRRK